MDGKNENKKTKELEDSLNEFLNVDKEKECEGEECLINYGKEIVKRIKKVYKNTDGKQT